MEELGEIEIFLWISEVPISISCFIGKSFWPFWKLLYEFNSTMLRDKLGTQLGELMISSLLLHLFKPLLYFISRYFPVTFFSNLISGHSHCQLCHADGFSCSTSYRVTSTWIKSPIDSRKPSDCSSIRHVLFHNFITNIGSRKSCSNCMELIQVSPFQLMAFVNDLSYTQISVRTNILK